MRAFSTVCAPLRLFAPFLESIYVDGGAALGFNFTVDLNLNPYFHFNFGENSSPHHTGTI